MCVCLLGHCNLSLGLQFPQCFEGSQHPHLLGVLDPQYEYVMICQNIRNYNPQQRRVAFKKTWFSCNTAIRISHLRMSVVLFMVALFLPSKLTLCIKDDMIFQKCCGICPSSRPLETFLNMLVSCNDRGLLVPHQMLLLEDFPLLAVQDTYQHICCPVQRLSSPSAPKNVPCFGDGGFTSLRKDR